MPLAFAICSELCAREVVSMTSEDHKIWASVAIKIAFILGMLSVLIWLPSHPDFAVFCAVMTALV